MSAVDAWLQERFEIAARTTTVPGRRRLCLVAVGGYGRRELCPHSDLDLVLVHDDAPGVDAVAQALWYPLWDSGVHVDHSVKTPRQALRVADSDLKAALGLLDGRRVAGDATLGDDLVAAARAQWRRRSSTSLGRLREAQQSRWASEGAVACALEPDLKNGRGGLRDVAAVRSALAALPFGLDDIYERALADAAQTLLDVRVALHLEAGRSTDRLTTDHQTAVARRLRLAGPDELLALITGAARSVDWVVDELWWRVGAQTARPAPRASDPRVVEPGIVLAEGRLGFASDVDAAGDPTLVLRLAAASGDLARPIHPRALEHISTDVAPVPSPWPAAARHALVDLLACGRRALPVIDTLDLVGAVARYIPEWAAVRNRPQPHPYHRYTVERHLNETVALAATRTEDVTRPDLLLLAAWLHDIGKGFDGDHAVRGAEIAAGIGRRIGLPADDVDRLAVLVGEHLLLATTATRFDVDDPATVEHVAARVGDGETLDLLAALTEADSIATGPAAWSRWKAGLVHRLVERVHDHLAGRPSAPSVRATTAFERAAVAARQTALVADDDGGVRVVAPDRPGLLATIAAVFALHRVSVREAAVGSLEGMALDVFEIELDRPEPPDWSVVEADLRRAAADPAWLQESLTRRAAPRRRRPGDSSGVQRRVSRPVVTAHDRVTPLAVVVEVRAPDRPGLLHDLASTVSDFGYDITAAKAITISHEAVDTFYLVDRATGAKPADDGAVRELVEALSRVAAPLA